MILRVCSGPVECGLSIELLFRKTGVVLAHFPAQGLESGLVAPAGISGVNALDFQTKRFTLGAGVAGQQIQGSCLTFGKIFIFAQQMFLSGAKKQDCSYGLIILCRITKL